MHIVKPQNNQLAYKLFVLDGIFFEILDIWDDKKEYLVKFIDRKNEVPLIYECKLKKGMWAKAGKRYLSDYFIEIWDGNELKKSIDVCKEFEGKRVFISFDSKSLGDSISWISSCLEFKKKYKCEVIVSTFLNFLFEKAYPELKFVGRGVRVENIVGMFELGWFYDKHREPILPSLIPLGAAATNILNLPYVEIPPKLYFEDKGRPYQEEYITISTISTSQLKHWYYWQDLINYLNSIGYKVVEVSKDPPKYDNCEYLEDISLQNTMNVIHHSKLFIGLSSGLSWLSWGIGKHVVMISNFTEKDHEFTINCTRIIDESICHGCWNNPKFKFDKGNWNYCPEHEDTPRHFECHKLISFEKVKNEVDQVLSKVLTTNP